MIFPTDLMKLRLSVFPEVIRTLASAQDENFMKLDKEEAKNSPRRNPGLSERVSLGQIAICVSNFERPLILSLSLLLQSEM